MGTIPTKRVDVSRSRLISATRSARIAAAARMTKNVFTRGVSINGWRGRTTIAAAPRIAMTASVATLSQWAHPSPLSTKSAISNATGGIMAIM